MAIKKPAMVLIDVDGTLVDSVPDLAYCVDEMMKQLDMPLRGEERVRSRQRGISKEEKSSKK